MTAPPSDIYEFADFSLDVAERRLLRRDGTVVPLTPRVFDTLRFLVEHSGRVLDKEMLMEAVWPDCIVEENNLTQNISTLRRLFGETPGSHRFIVTIPSRGYRFVAGVKACDRQPPETETRKVEHGTVAASASQPSLTAAAPSQALPQERRHLGQLIAAGVIVALLSFTAFLFFHGRSRRPAESSARREAPALVILEKSIAVLPFENLSDDKENSYFAAGIQDDVLTSLAQIHELKVISRTSVMAYQKPDGRNMREIGRALGVANVLEGSVRRTGNRVLVSVQLIDARSDRHLWAERYDRTIADSIGLQGELATQIAAALKATLAPEEKGRLGVEPTANSEAYVLYLTALGKEGTDEIAAERLYVEAATVDPKFALAYARASLLNSQIASYNQHREQKAKARAQAEEALRLSPTLGEGHMALGLCLYWGEKNYDAALKEFELAAQISPSNAKIYDYVGGIYRRQGRWREAMASYERALSLDPRNASIANFAGNNYLYVRDWPAAGACYTHALEIKPDSVWAKIRLAYLEVYRNANPAAGGRVLENIPASLDSDGEVALTRWDMAMLERDYAVAEKILSDLPVEKFKTKDAPKTYYQGRTALARDDKESAQRYFTATIPALEKWVRDAPDDPERHGLIGLLYAYMHRNEDAIREARRAVELEPESQDAFHGAMEAANLAMVYALIGEQDPAITLIERLLSTPGPFPGSGADSPSEITLTDLRLRWEWDSLRSNPRFQKILASPEPKTILTATR
jgi:TolB-like protein/DNA-binding winged helix-turn-helix (wHTH) protein/Flp pilus assembly protein TadD